MKFRPITASDIPALFDVRVATDENNLSRAQLTAMGITEATVLEQMQRSYRGWLCEIDGSVVGFAMGDRATGELWVIAVLPGCIRRGVGSGLMQRVEEWLFSEGWEELWLTTDIDTRLRAYSFYRHRGWFDDAIRDGLRYMKKRRPAAGAAGQSRA